MDGRVTIAPLEGGPAAGFGRAVIRWRWLILLLTIAAVLTAGAGLRLLTFNPDSRVYFGPDDPGRQALDRLENTFAKSTNVLFALAPQDGDVFAPEVLKAVQDLTERAWQIPYSSRVNSLTNYQHSYAEGDQLIVEPLVDEDAQLGARELAEIRRIALSRPELVDRIVAADGGVTAVNVEIIKPDRERGETAEVASFARELADRMGSAYPEIDVYVTGGVMTDITFAEAAQSDFSILVPVMLVLVVATLLVGLRSFYATLATVMVVLFSVVVALGTAGWTGLVLNSATAGTPIVIMTLSLANCVHLVTSMRRRHASASDKESAICEALRVNRVPITITSLTTAVGFTTLNFSESPPLQQFGNIIALGVVAAYVLSTTFFPALLSLLPIARPRATDPTAAAMKRLADFVVRRWRILLVAAPVVLAVLLSGLPRLYIDDDFVRYFDDNFEFRRDTDFVQENLVGLNLLYFPLSSGEAHAIADPSYLAAVDAFAEWYRAQENVKHVWVITDLLKRLNMNMHRDDPAFHRIPEVRELAAQYLLFYEMSLPFGHDLNNQIDIARSATRMSVSLDEVSSAEVRELAARGEAWLEENAPSMATPATGLSIVYAHMSERNIRSMLGGTLVALVLISGILLFVLRSLPTGLVSLAPNLFPALMAFGFWGYLNGEVNLAVSVVGAMTLGIVVDDTVYLLTRYLRGRREYGMEPVDAVRYSIASVGVPMMITSLALALGFAVMAFSGFAVSALMGSLSATTIAFALVADLLFLPPLLILLGKRIS